MQYAIIATGGKQYQVEVGKELEVELLHAEGKVSFDQVLLVVDGDNVTVGAPTVSGVVVAATVVGQVKADKIDILRYKSKSRYRKHTGHRQKYTKVMIDSIGDMKIAPKPVKVTKVAAEVVSEKPVKVAKKPAVKKAVKVVAK